MTDRYCLECGDHEDDHEDADHAFVPDEEE